ncbi:MAG: hypothetical protein KGJ13_03275 [Patescibacteria group bacterium]|nr:hypothetical protein [Patescibacteria group bacterium]
MLTIKRSAENPILLPAPQSPWEAEAVFNPSVVEKDKLVHMFYRAVGKKPDGGEISVIGHTVSKDGERFPASGAPRASEAGNRTQFVVPEYDWEKFGCEDPRVTEFEGRYYIFYTAVREFSADGIKVAVAVSDDLQKVAEKHLVTPFNAKAMALFPERVNGKIAALLTINTDRPPARICIALFDKIEDLWSEEYWKNWYADIGKHYLDIEMTEKDQVEVGSAPIKTKEGWLIFYSYIYNYFAPPAIFGVQAMLLDFDDPRKIVGEVKRPFLVPEEEYEHYGKVPHIVFPSGALIRRSNVYLYYGAADTTCCVAIFKLGELLEELVRVARRQLQRFEKNPIIMPIGEHAWEAQATFNPAAIYENRKVHILYRAMSNDNTSVIGYASSLDGVHITERLPEPIYVPRADFERKGVPGGNSGCEDPRITKLGDRIYICYTAYDGKDPPRVAFASIPVGDFVAQKWDWTMPVLISPPGLDDKDACLFPKKIGGKYWFLHRLASDIWIDSADSLDYFDGEEHFLGGKILMRPRDTAWDSKRIGITAPPIETKGGWLLLYHGISKRTNHYNVRAVLLDLNDPSKILYRTHDTMLEPKMPYEKEGVVNNVVFPCGAVVLRKQLFVYYGGADKVVGVAMGDLQEIVSGLEHEARYHSKQ